MECSNRMQQCKDAIYPSRSSEAAVDRMEDETTDEAAGEPE